MTLTERDEPTGIEILISYKCPQSAVKYVLEESIDAPRIWKMLSPPRDFTARIYSLRHCEQSKRGAQW